MATTFGTRPEDTVADSRGNVLSGVVLELYPTEADANAKTSFIASVSSNASGLWPYSDASGRTLLWVRDPNGNVWPVGSEEALGQVGNKADKSYVDAGFAPVGNAPKTFTAGSGDQTTALQSFLDALSDGDDVLLRGSSDFTTLTISRNNVRVRLAPGAVLNKTTALTDGIVVSGSGVVLEGGSVNCPATWDGTNTAWTYAVVNVTGARATVRGVTFNNVPKVGIGVREVDDTIIEGCRIYGNYPAASWTGVETVNFGITWDPSAGASGTGIIVRGNHIQSCVQGIFLGNYGGGIGYGANISGNRFYGCHNHGVYSSTGVHADAIVGNTFYRCQVPVAATGQGHTVSGNTMFTSTTGGNLDQTGISLRDPSDCVVADNTIVGDGTASNCGISLEQISLNSIMRNVVSGNVIDLGSTGGLPAIRVGSTTTNSLDDNRIEGNLVRGAGQVNIGLIALSVSTGNTGNRNTVSNNTLVIKGATNGIYLQRQAYAEVVNNTIATEYDAASATTIARVALNNTVDSVVRGNRYVNTASWGTNVTLHGAREFDAVCDRNVLGPNFVRDSLTKAAGSFEVVQNNAANASLIGVDVGEYAAATALGTLSGKVEIRDGKGAIKGYAPVYTTIT